MLTFQATLASLIILLGGSFFVLFCMRCCHLRNIALPFLLQLSEEPSPFSNTDNQNERSNRYKRLDTKLEKKVLEVKNTSSSRHNEFQRIDSIIMKFPQFKEGLKNIKAVYHQYDEDSNGKIDKEELKKCLDEVQLHLSEKDMEDLFHSCDIDENQEIRFKEFIVLLCLIYLLKESSSTNETEKIGSPSIQATFDTIIEAFLFLDKDGDGNLKKKDVIKALNDTSRREKSPLHVTRKRFKEMDWGRKGKVSFREFLFTFIDWVGVETNGNGDSSSYRDVHVYGDDLPS